MHIAKHYVSQLSDLIQAEAEGQSVDCERVRHLAAMLAERHPGIRNSMAQIIARMGDVRLSRAA